MATESDNAPLIVILGETASGKTAAAIEIAERVNGEIICADSRTVYKGLPVSTAKPSKKDMQSVKHHLINCIDPLERYTAAQFKQQANDCMVDIASRGKVPILVGGTGLYIDAVLFNFQFRPAVSDAKRAALTELSMIELQHIAKEKNIASDQLNTKNKRHLIRTIETDGAPSVQAEMRSHTYVTGFQLERELLNQRIKNRVQLMIENGLIEEVNNFAARYGWDNHLINSAAHHVVRDYDNKVATLHDVEQAFIKRDKSLAKRQRTWFRRNKAIEWHAEHNELVSSAVGFMQNKRHTAR